MKLSQAKKLRKGDRVQWRNGEDTYDANGEVTERTLQKEWDPTSDKEIKYHQLTITWDHCEVPEFVSLHPIDQYFIDYLELE